MKTTKNPTHVIYYSKDYRITASQNVYGKAELHYLINCFLKEGYNCFEINKL